MTTEIIKSLATDFSGSLDTVQLRQEIIDDETITTVHHGGQIVGDVVTLFFASSLSAPELTQLDVLIAAHSPILYTNTLSVSATGPTSIQTADTGSVNVFFDTDSSLLSRKDSAGVVKPILAPCYEVKSSTTTSTTSSTYTLMNAMTVTPSAGVYLATFTASGRATETDQLINYALFKDGTIVAHSERNAHNTGAGYMDITLHTSAVITFTGSETCEVHYKSSGSHTMSVFQRTMTLVQMA
jgi:hypothetical protein